MSNKNLCSFDEVIEFSGLKIDSSDENTLINNLIARVSEIFCNYCIINNFLETIYTEYHDGDGTNFLYTKNIPIMLVTSIHDDSNWEYGSDTLIDSDDYRIVSNRYIVLKDNVFTNGIQNIKIIYKAGYTEVPSDVKQAAIEEVYRKFKNRKDIDITAKNLQDGSVNYVEKGLLVNTKQVLLKYRNNIGVF